MTEHVLTDIIGTTTKYPQIYVEDEYLEAHGEGFFRNIVAQSQERKNESSTEMVEEIQSYFGHTDPEEIVSTILEETRKGNLDPFYMKLLGEVLSSGYNSGEVTGHVFDDVPAAFDSWKKNGYGIFVYSGGSVKNQIALLKATQHGDVTENIDGHFDTAGIGTPEEKPLPKDERDSYLRISDTIESDPDNVLFLSDNPSELEAAAKAGMPVHLVQRPENKDVDQPERYNPITTFLEIEYL